MANHPLHFRYRPKTQDEMMIKEVYFDNCYHLPDRFQPTDIVLDIGAHIGSFTMACLERGCKKVWAYEPARENQKYLALNIRDNRPRWPDAEISLFELAVVEAGNYQRYMPFHYTGDLNSACGHLVDPLVDPRDEVTPTSYFVDTTTFAEVVNRALDDMDGDMIRFCKIDIEGAEIPILMQADQRHMKWALAHIAELALEYHGDYLDILKLKLEDAGFEDIGFEPVHPAIPLTQQGLLFARHTSMLYGKVPEDSGAVVKDGLICKVIHHGKDENSGAGSPEAGSQGR
jgi:FkbM family methyltransferase